MDFLQYILLHDLSRTTCVHKTTQETIQFIESVPGTRPASTGILTKYASSTEYQTLC